jgi:class 3 adenylate cyclase
MLCPKCSSVVAESSKFCPNCGAPLGASQDTSASIADHSALLQNYIPPELAKKILSAGKQIESERRHVTILFADVSGFTAMSEKLDPEVVSTVLNDCFRGLISIILKYEGMIDKFIGDEIMAIFGAPLAHENDPERAVRCSLEMMSYIRRFNTLSPVQLPVPLNLHIGLHSGMVIAGNVGSDLRMSYSVLGDTVNLAARLVSLAPSGEVYISEDAYKLVSGIIQADGPHATAIKGKAESVNIYKLLSLKGGAEAGIKASRTKEFIGREKELETITLGLDLVKNKKEKRIFVRGEAGVGKTRLKDELLTLARSRNISTFEGKCSSFELNTPYYLWNTLLKSLLRIGLETTEIETKQRLHDTLQILSLQDHEPYLATLISLRYEQILLEEDESRKRKIFEAVRELLKAYATRQTTVFILEDLHWIDRFSQELLEFLFNQDNLAPAMFFTLFRDEYTASKNIMTHGDQIDLNRLSKEEARKLILSRFAVDAVPATVEKLVFERSEGNPFFIEEIIKTLVDKKVIAVKQRKVRLLNNSIFEKLFPMRYVR